MGRMQYMDRVFLRFPSILFLPKLRGKGWFMYCEFVIKLYKAGFSMKLTVAMQGSFVHK